MFGDTVFGDTELTDAGFGDTAFGNAVFGDTGFGDTADEARQSLRREVSSYLEDCEQLGVLDEVLIEAGFYDNDEVWMSSLVEPPKEPKITFI